MDWSFLSDIACDIRIPIVQPYNRLLKYKELLYDCYVKVNDRYIPFIDGYAQAYAEFIKQTMNQRTLEHQGRPVIADLTQICQEFSMMTTDIEKSLMIILDLYIMGRLHHRQTNIVDELVIPSSIIFQVMYILNILNSKYHIEALLTLTLADVYNRIFDSPFPGYTKQDRANIRFYLTILISFEPTNTEIIYHFLQQNSMNSRFVDLFGIIRDYLTEKYYTEVIPILQRLTIANSDQYYFADGHHGISFLNNITIVDRRHATINTLKELQEMDKKPFILRNPRSLQIFPTTITKIITPQMIQDRLPLDINRNIHITIEGMISSIIYPIIKTYFFTDNTLPSTIFSLYYVPNTNNILYKIQVSLSIDLVSFNIKTENITPQTEITDDEIIDYIFKNSQVLDLAEKFLSVSLLEFSSLYPDDTPKVYSILGIPIPQHPQPLPAQTQPTSPIVTQKHIPKIIKSPKSGNLLLKPSTNVHKSLPISPLSIKSPSKYRITPSKKSTDKALKK